MTCAGARGFAPAGFAFVCGFRRELGAAKVWGTESEQRAGSMGRRIEQAGINKRPDATSQRSGPNTEANGASMLHLCWLTVCDCVKAALLRQVTMFAGGPGSLAVPFGILFQP